jgi:hypothetical protein
LIEALKGPDRGALFKPLPDASAEDGRASARGSRQRGLLMQNITSLGQRRRYYFGTPVIESKAQGIDCGDLR